MCHCCFQWVKCPRIWAALTKLISRSDNDNWESSKTTRRLKREPDAPRLPGQIKIPKTSAEHTARCASRKPAFCTIRASQLLSQAVNIISELKFKEETSNVLYFQQVGMVLNFGTVRKLDRNTCKVLECVAGEVWKRTFGPIV